MKRKFKRKIKVDENSPEESPLEEQELKSEQSESAESGEVSEERIASSVLDEEKSEETPTTDLELKDSEDSGEERESEKELPEDELSVARRESAENLDKFLRTAAELENIKKRNIKERQELIKYAGEGLARDLLDVADGLELALNQENKGSLDEFVKGVELIRSQLQGVLERHQIKAESLVGQDFQPEKAEALAAVPTEGDKVGKVLEEFKKAYHFKDKLLRPAQVVVGKEAQEEEKAAAEDDSDSKESEEQ